MVHISFCETCVSVPRQDMPRIRIRFPAYLQKTDMECPFSPRQYTHFSAILSALHTAAAEGLPDVPSPPRPASPTWTLFIEEMASPVGPAHRKSRYAEKTILIDAVMTVCGLVFYEKKISEIWSTDGRFFLRMEKNSPISP